MIAGIVTAMTTVEGMGRVANVVQLQMRVDRHVPRLLLSLLLLCLLLPISSRHLPLVFIVFVVITTIAIIDIIEGRARIIIITSTRNTSNTTRTCRIGRSPDRSTDEGGGRRSIREASHLQIIML